MYLVFIKLHITAQSGPVILFNSNIHSMLLIILILAMVL